MNDDDFRTLDAIQTGLLVLVATDVSFDAGKTEHAAALIRGLESGVRLALAVSPGGG